MMTPTERVTSRAREFLADDFDVILAVRVEWGPQAVVSRTKFSSGFWTRAYLWSPIVMPIVALLRRGDRIVHPESGFGVLALTSDDSRVLLSVASRRRSFPTGLIDVLPQGAHLEVDVGLMETNLIPVLRISDREFVVNSVDFRALLKAVEQLRIRAPEIRAALPALREVGASPYTV